MFGFMHARRSLRGMMSMTCDAADTMCVDETSEERTFMDLGAFLLHKTGEYLGSCRGWNGAVTPGFVTAFSTLV